MDTTINNTFNMSRFGWLLRKDLKENGKLYLMGLVLMWGVLALANYFAGYLFLDKGEMMANELRGNAAMSYFLESKFEIFILFPFVFGLVVSSLAFSKLKSKTGRIDMLMLPASNLEKYMVRWLISTLVFMVCYVLVFLLADASSCYILGVVYPEKMSIPMLDLSEVFNLNGDSQWITTLCMLAFLHSFYFLGSAVAPKLSFLKTFVVLSVLSVIYSIFAAICQNVIFADAVFNPSGETVEILESVIRVGLLVLAVVNYVIAYYRFKESEVIHRLF